MNKNRDNDQYSEQETEQRREAALKRMLSTPPKRHEEMKIGKAKGKRAPSPADSGSKRRKDQTAKKS